MQRIWASRGWGRFVAAALLERVRLSCQEGRMSESIACLDRSERVVEEHPAPKSCVWSDIHRYGALARAHVALSQGRPQSAIAVLMNLQREAGNTHSYYFGLGVGTHIATAYLRAGANTDALVVFRKILNVGLKVGLYQTILDQGPEIGTLLLSVRDNAARTGDATDFVSYLDRLLKGCRAHDPP